MNINDLMIGDWVLKLEQGGHYKKAKITAIYKDTISCVKSNNIEYILSINAIEPIPLTPEILEKNGIVYDYDQEECVADYTYIKVKGYLYQEEYVLIDYYNGHIKLINDISNTVVEMNINYVHELQHALRLCKIEKEIKL